jgi:hypothetical protein
MIRTIRNRQWCISVSGQLFCAFVGSNPTATACHLPYAVNRLNIDSYTKLKANHYLTKYSGHIL